MASNSNDWYFTKEQLDNTPSRQCGIEAYKELSYRQQAANFIQDMGQRLKVSQLCINTAIVYMHRFYVFHSFTHFPWHSIATAALFLAAKVEEQPRKLEHVIRCANLCKNPRDTSFDTTSERYMAQSQDLVFNENILLQTLGFDVAIDHPHTHVVRCCHLVRASKDLAQTSYFMASNSLHLTMMCLQYKPTVVACFCIHLACKWSNWEIPLSNEQKEWFSYVDSTVTSELLQQLTDEFLVIFERCSSRLKEKIMAVGECPAYAHTSSHSSSPLFQEPDRKFPLPVDQKDLHAHRPRHDGKQDDLHKQRLSRPHDPANSQQQRDREREYREKKDRERLGHHTNKPPNLLVPPSNKHVPPPHGHRSNYPPSGDPIMKRPRPPSLHLSTASRLEPRDILREATRELGLRDHREPVAETGREVPVKDSRDTATRDLQIRGDKDVQKRDFLLQKQDNKPVSANDVTSLPESRANFSTEKRVDPNRIRPYVDPKLQQKPHDQMRRREDVKSYPKLENDIKKHLNSAIQDKISAYLHKSVNPTSQQKLRSPFTSEVSKSVPTQSSSQPNPLSVKSEVYSSASTNGIYCTPDAKIKPEAVIKEEPVIAVKKPSLFSPEKSPPHKKPTRIKTPPGKRMSDTSSVVPLPLSPFDSPKNSANRRNRTSSSSSEPELRPVMTKIDQIEGFENLMRDSSIGIKYHQVPDIITPITDTRIKPERVENIQTSIAKEMKPPDLIPPFNSLPIVNGIETNPTLISNLLKETPAVSHLQTVVAPTSSILEPAEKEKEHHHKERKKSKKEKHKHKDKEKNREEKEKKKKHKDKDREKHKHKHEKHENVAAEPPTTQPIKITILKDKIHPPENVTLPSTGLKIKIPKDRIKTESIGESSQSASLSGGLKIKISKEVINFSNDSRKRERDKSSPVGAPPNKILKTSHNRLSDTKHNGKNSYNKVAQLGDGDTSVHRLAESKYINKGAAT